MMPATALSTLEHLFDREHELPIDRTLLLQRIGWLHAQRMGEACKSTPDYVDWLDLHEEMHEACSGSRGWLEFNLGCSAMHRPRTIKPPTNGWCIAWAIRQSNAHGLTPTGKFMYHYRSKAGITHDVQWGAFAGVGGALTNTRIACFTINGVRIFWYQVESDSLGAFFLETNWSNSDSTPFVLEVVRPRASVFRYARYDSRSNSTSVTTTHTNYFAVVWDGAKCPPCLGEPLNDLGLPKPFDLVNYDSDTIEATIRMLNSEVLFDLISSVLLIGRSRTDNDYQHISNLLTKQLRERLWRVGRELLFHWVQLKQEAIAADPVKKCAACAIEAVKSQLALGIEPKRQRLG